MMVVTRGQPGWRHQGFRDLPALLPANSLLVVNDTRVAPVRLTARLPKGVPIEALLVESLGPGRWRALVKKGRRLKPGMVVPFAQGELSARAEHRTEQGDWVLAFETPDTFAERLERLGLAPLPPYIHRDIHQGYDPAPDREAYQTLFARNEGAIAAPTAALHFTPPVLRELDARGLERVALTLHVGLGTFQPVKTSDPKMHTMHREWFQISPTVARTILEARSQGRPVVAIGTTTVRALESWAALGTPPGFSGWSHLFIQPPHDFLAVDALLTNFHLPRSTLLMLVSALHGRELLMAAYAEAVHQAYRFYSFGDCMLILPEESRRTHASMAK